MTAISLSAVTIHERLSGRCAQSRTVHRGIRLFGLGVGRTAEEAIELLRSGKVKAISLDHDLGIGQKTGYDVLLWMEEHDVWPETIRIHSMNPVGRQRMLAVLEACQRRQASGADSRTGG